MSALKLCQLALKFVSIASDDVVMAINPLNPDDAIKHPFTFQKTDLIFLQLTVLEGNFP